MHDTAISSISLGPGHNPTESLVAMLEGTPYTTDLDPTRLRAIKDHRGRTGQVHQFMSAITGVETPTSSTPRFPAA